MPEEETTYKGKKIVIRTGPTNADAATPDRANPGDTGAMDMEIARPKTPPGTRKDHAHKMAAREAGGVAGPAVNAPLSEGPQETEVLIDGQAIKVIATREGGLYWSPHAPFVHYSSPLEAAKAVVDRMASETER